MIPAQTEVLPMNDTNPHTLLDTLHLISKTLGSDTLTDGSKLLSAFTDLAPQLKKERNLLKLFIDAGGSKKLYAAKDFDPDTLHAAVKSIIRDLNENWSMDQKAAESICSAYYQALTGKSLPPLKASNSKKTVDKKDLSSPDKEVSSGKQKTRNVKPEPTPPIQKADPAPAPQTNPLSTGGCLLAFLAWAAAFVGLLFFFTSSNFGTPIINTFILMIPFTGVILFCISKYVERKQQKK